MIETESEEVSEEIVIEGIKLAKQENAKVIKFIEELRGEAGVPKEEPKTPLFDEKIVAALKKDYLKQIDEMMLKKAEKEFEDKGAVQAVVDAVAEQYKEEFDKKAIAKAVTYLGDKTLHDKVIKTRKRIDGRGADEVRKIYCET